MRKSRLKLQGTDAYYHCMSRTVHGIGPNSRIRFAEVDKEILRGMIRRVADFSGVDILSYCVMDNHFHVLVRVPDCAREISDTELVRRYKVLYPKPTNYQLMAPHVLESILAKGGAEAESVRKGFLQRMGDVSEYIKTLKQRFSVYFNRTHKRSGTLWSERFKSVLVEPDRYALLAVSAYIDLNPVRAGIVKDPKDYRYASYAEAVVGNKKARKGIALTLGGPHICFRAGLLAEYRMSLFGIGSHKNREHKAFIARGEAIRVLDKEKGRLPMATLLRCRLRYFTDGLVLGSPKYVSLVLGKQLRKKIHPLPIEEEPDHTVLAVGKGFRGAIWS